MKRIAVIILGVAMGMTTIAAMAMDPAGPEPAETRMDDSDPCEAERFRNQNCTFLEFAPELIVVTRKK